MSIAFEAFLARLYTDAELRRRFLADPRAVAGGGAGGGHGLSAEEIQALVDIDRVGLELAAASFARKRR